MSRNLFFFSNKLSLRNIFAFPKTVFIECEVEQDLDLVHLVVVVAAAIDIQ